MPGRMTKLGRDETGITVDGEDYKDFLARKEEKEKEDEVEAERKNEIGTKTKHKKKLKPRERYEDDPRRVSKRVTRLSDFEIRKEYGIMAKPFKTLTQNVLYVLFSAGESTMNSRAIADELGKSLPDVSSVLSGIWKKLKGDEIIQREKVGLAYHYRMTDKGLFDGFDPVFRKYFPPQGGVRKKKEPAEKEEIPEWYKGSHKYFMETNQMLLQRIESLETDGLEGVIKKMRKDYNGALNKQENNINYLKGLVADVRQALDDGLEDKAKAIAGSYQPGEFNINVNVRLLLR